MSTASLKRVPFSTAVRVVATREVMVRLRSKSFMVSSALLLLLVIAGVIVGSTAGGSFSSSTQVATTSETGLTDGSLPETEFVQVADDDAVRAEVASGDADAGVIGSPEVGFTVIGDRTEPGSLIAALSIPPEVELLQPDAPNPVLANLAGLGFGILFFMAAVIYGNQIAYSVVEEKQTRIVEILLATIPARAILAGKIVGNSLLAFAQVALLAAGVLGTSAAVGNTLILDGFGVPLLWFVALFTVGFVLLASLYAATAALVSRSEDIASATTPITMIVMIPYLLVITFNNNPSVLAIMSYVPFSAPVAVPMRLFLGTTQWWEPILSLVILAATAVVAIAISARIYERSVLLIGARVKLSRVLRTAA